MLDSYGEKEKLGGLILIFLILAIAVDFFVWQRIIFAKAPDSPRIYFLDIGQGDSELAILPGNVKIMTDAGPDSKITRELEKIPELADKYIDIAVISHPQLDHFNGFRYLLSRYRVGAFIYNGRSDSPSVNEWPDLVEKIKQNNIPLIRLGAGDKIKHSDSKIDFLSPDPDLVQSAELNDTGLVEFLESRGLKAIFTADINDYDEKALVKRFDLRADILKVAHHGSRFSSSAEFLMAVKPKVAVIEVGDKNKYGHPTKEALQRISAASATIFRTDKNGQITALVDNGKLKIFTEK